MTMTRAIMTIYPSTLGLVQLVQQLGRSPDQLPADAACRHGYHSCARCDAMIVECRSAAERMLAQLGEHTQADIEAVVEGWRQRVLWGQP